MNDAIKGTPQLSRGNGADNRIARLERAVDLLLKFVGGLEQGLGIQFKRTDNGDSIRINAEGTGGAAANNMAWTATADGDTISYLGGTVSFFGGGGEYTFDGDTHDTHGDDAYCFLYWDASAENGKGSWDIVVDDDGYPETSDMDDGDVFIPLWKYVDEVLVQETVGAVVIPAIKNVVDQDESDDDSDVPDGDEEEEGDGEGEGGEGGEGEGGEGGGGGGEGEGSGGESQGNGAE